MKVSTIQFRVIDNYALSPIVVGSDQAIVDLHLTPSWP